MPFRTSRVIATSDSAVQALAAATGDLDVELRSNGQDFYIGDSGVTAATGFRVTPQTPFKTDVTDGDELWVLAVTSPVAVDLIIRS